jgi:polysaccharide deacetylase family protein (PEP-CTERM system associated)
VRTDTGPEPCPAGLGAMTIDVEDYYQVEAFASTIDRKDWDRLPARVEHNTYHLLDILAAAETRATFFTLGCLAWRYPSMIRRIVADGHELASHGTDHLRADRQTAAGFRADVRDSKKILEDIGSIAVAGYRAPTFSIGRESAWSHAILAEEGYLYSSSVYPVKRDLYGTPGAPHSPFLPTPGLLEIPLTTVRVFGKDIPASGGGYFRLFPYSLSRWLLSQAWRPALRPSFTSTLGKSIRGNPGIAMRRCARVCATILTSDAPSPGYVACCAISVGRGWIGYSWRGN